MYFIFPKLTLKKVNYVLPFCWEIAWEYDDWLICMISSQTRQYIAGFDEIIQENDADIGESGLKVTSVIRVGRLAVVSGRFLWVQSVKFPLKD